MRVLQVFPHEYRRALGELALESKAQLAAEREKQELENEFDEDAIKEEDLTLKKDKVRHHLSQWGRN